MNVQVIGSLKEVTREEWNALCDPSFPFTYYDFLYGLEEHQAVGEKYGWYPQFITVRDENNTLLGGLPMYIKDNSYGEFVFDWAWADAYHRHQLPYYPKLVVSIPYTPATGPRLLVHPDADQQLTRQVLIDAALQHAEQFNMSSLHCLFTNKQDTDFFKQHPKFMLRLGYQFHWHNQDYESFEHYLSFFTSKKRKQVKRERRIVNEQEIKLEILHGQDINDETWAIYHGFYRDTFERKSGMPTLSQSFFQSLGESMPDNVVLVMASHQGKYVASAFNFRGSDSLYGRHWGCSADYDNLHFEACYYQGLDYCIDNKLKLFEPGAQGEHKISRGFLPTKTWSAHWLAHPGFSEAIERYLQQETDAIEDYLQELDSHSPFK